MKWRILLGYGLLHKALISKVLLALVLTNCFQICLPFLTQAIVDIGIDQKNVGLIQTLLFAYIFLMAGQMMADIIRNRATMFLTGNISFSLMSHFWSRLLKLPLHFFETRQIGDMLQRVGDHKRIEGFIGGSILQTCFSIFTFIGFSIVLFSYSPMFFFVVLGTAILQLLWILIFLQRRRTVDTRRFHAMSQESSKAIELVEGIHDIKVNNAYDWKKHEWEKIQFDIFKVALDSMSLNQGHQLGSWILTNGKNVAIMYLSALMMLDGDLSFGGMLAIQFVNGALSNPMQQLSTLSRGVQDASLALERLLEVQKLKGEDMELTGEDQFLPKIGTGIYLHNVSFSYPDHRQTVLENVSVHIPPKQVTAIVGASGSGKTTLLKVLQKAYTDYLGEITVGGVDLQGINVTDWRNVIGSVMPDGYIFDSSIAQNISMSSAPPDGVRLLEACKIASIVDVIQSMPLGFQTNIGRNGVELSTGQRQRILIARAIYRQPEILFFDEATNALDALNEKNIMNNVFQHFRCKTVVVVAHRLSTVVNAHKIIVLEDGRIKEVGTHSMLMRGQNAYYRLVRYQIQGSMFD